MSETIESAHLLAQMRAAFPSLSPQLRQAARFLLDRPDEVAFSSMRQLAAKAGVQPATMVRLAQRMGCAGYDEWREPFRDRLRRRPASYEPRARDLQARTGASGVSEGLARLVAEIIAADRDNLTVILEAIGAERLGAAAAKLAKARWLYVVGLRSQYPAAFYVHYACRMFRTSTSLLDAQGGTFADDLRGIGADDAMLVFSVLPYSRESVEAARFAAERGAAVVSVTDSTVAPVARLSACTLCVATDGPALFRSVVPTMAVAQVLVALLLAQGGQVALARVAESEAQLNRFDAYWPETELADKPANGEAEISR